MPSFCFASCSRLFTKSSFDTFETAIVHRWPLFASSPPTLKQAVSSEDLWPTACHCPRQPPDVAGGPCVVAFLFLGGGGGGGPFYAVVSLWYALNDNLIAAPLRKSPFPAYALPALIWREPRPPKGDKPRLARAKLALPLRQSFLTVSSPVRPAKGEILPSPPRISSCHTIICAPRGSGLVPPILTGS